MIPHTSRRRATIAALAAPLMLAALLLAIAVAFSHVPQPLDPAPRTSSSPTAT